MIEELQEQVEKERNEKREAFTQADDNLLKLNEAQNELSELLKACLEMKLHLLCKGTLQSKIEESNNEVTSLLNEKVSLTKQLEEMRTSNSQNVINVN